MKKLNADILISLAIMSFATTMFLLALKMPEGPGFFPKIILSILFLFSVKLLISGVIKCSEDIKNNKVDKTFEKISHPISTFVIICLYVGLIDFLGFFASTSIFLVSFMVYYNINNYFKITGVILGVNLFIYFLFVQQLHISLPAGILF